MDKSSFVSKALGLPHVRRSQAAALEIPYRRRYYLVRLLEVAIDDIHVNQDDSEDEDNDDEDDEEDDEDDDALDYKHLHDHRVAPKIDGALALYDVRDGSSIEQLDDMLGELRFQCRRGRGTVSTAERKRATLTFISNNQVQFQRKLSPPSSSHADARRPKQNARSIQQESKRICEMPILASAPCEYQIPTRAVTRGPSPKC